MVCYNCKETGHSSRFCKKARTNQVDAPEGDIDGDEDEDGEKVPPFVKNKFLSKYVEQTGRNCQTRWRGVVDSGATHHVVDMARGRRLRERRGRRKIRISSVIMANGRSSAVDKQGILPVIVETGKNILLKDVLCVPDTQKNIISVSQLIDDGFSVHFTPPGICSIEKGNKNYCRTMKQGNLWYISFLQSFLQNEEPATLLSIEYPSNLWHLRLGHPSHGNLCRLQKVAEGIPTLNNHILLTAEDVQKENQKDLLFQPRTVGPPTP
jgi:hypothetical protein